jgi:hypothetical protein
VPTVREQTLRGAGQKSAVRPVGGAIRARIYLVVFGVDTAFPPEKCNIEVATRNRAAVLFRFIIKARAVELRRQLDAHVAYDREVLDFRRSREIRIVRDVFDAAACSQRLNRYGPVPTGCVPIGSRLKSALLSSRCLGTIGYW